MLTEEQQQRQDEVDNTIYDLICDLAGGEVEWEIDFIGAVRDVISQEFQDRGIMTEMEFYPYMEVATNQVVDDSVKMTQETVPDHLHNMSLEELFDRAKSILDSYELVLTGHASELPSEHHLALTATAEAIGMAELGETADMANTYDRGIAAIRLRYPKQMAIMNR